MQSLINFILFPLLLFGSSYKDRIDGHTPLRIKSNHLEFMRDRAQEIDKISATKKVSVHFANKILIQTENIHYLGHERLESDIPGECQFTNGLGHLSYTTLSYDLKKDHLSLQGVTGTLRLHDQTEASFKSKKLLLIGDNLILEGETFLTLPSLGKLHADNKLCLNSSILDVVGKMELINEDSPTPFTIHCDDQFLFDTKKGLLSATSKETSQLLFKTEKLHLYADNLTLNYEENHPVRVQLEGAVRIEPRNRHIAFDTLLCDRVDFPLEEEAMLLVTNGKQQHLFWESAAPDNIYLGEGEIP